ncbi:MAG TPA: hypothetical protein VHA33_22020 [Candidatus Angelobacter sp.]|jgi:hypothetical protein|nr:hypothetical protein [Candidatus Angelobacter sp.]
MPPNWLPQMLVVDPWTQNTFDELYAVFTRDFKTTRPTLNGAEVWFFPEMEDGKECIFWHLTQRDDKHVNDRLPDFARCARLCWIRAIIDNASSPEVLCWDYIESDKSLRTYLWLRNDDYIIVLKKMPNGSHRLITAHCIDYASKRRTLQSKYEKRIR